MLEFRKGNMFESGAQTLTNAVNCKGVMGKGLALVFKKKFPKMFIKYKELCENKKLYVGKLILIKEKDCNILLFPTKDHWFNDSQAHYITSGLKYLRNNYKKMGITSLALPALGCGLGGLKWKEVKADIQEFLYDIDIPVYVYEPLGEGKNG
jgi:O-acetyl-ADP-ribose deacetylase (regulator of RNase III)